ncbi:MAG: hypothetical protein KAV00_14900, partial [Phycisphaerae bacterium]|nr:hypothetical protein [Phycisphaerae bacterium]
MLSGLGVSTSNWYRACVPPAKRKRPGPRAKPLALEVVEAVVTMARSNPWYGYKRIAVMCRRAGASVTNRQAYRVM